MRGLEKLDDDDDGDYCVHLPEGDTLVVYETEDGTLEEEMVLVSYHSTRPVTLSGISSETQSFITARTGKEFEPNASQ